MYVHPSTSVCRRPTFPQKLAAFLPLICPQETVIYVRPLHPISTQTSTAQRMRKPRAKQESQSLQPDGTPPSVHHTKFTTTTTFTRTSNPSQRHHCHNCHGSQPVAHAEPHGAVIERDVMQRFDSLLSICTMLKDNISTPIGIALAIVQQTQLLNRPYHAE